MLLSSCFSQQIFTFALLFGIFSFLATMASASMPGAPISQETDDPEVQNLVQKAMAKMNAESNGIYQIVPVKILKARSQVVAGTLWRIKVAVGQSKCLKNQASSDGAESCAYEGNESKQQIYNVEIWQKPWEKFEQITYKLADSSSSEEEEDGN